MVEDEVRYGERGGFSGQLTQPGDLESRFLGSEVPRYSGSQVLRCPGVQVPRS